MNPNIHITSFKEQDHESSPVPCIKCNSPQGTLNIFVAGGYGSEIDGLTVKIGLCHTCAEKALKNGLAKIVDAEYKTIIDHPDNMSEEEKKKYDESFLDSLRS